MLHECIFTFSLPVNSDNHPGTSSESSPFFAMSGDGSTDIVIPLVFLFTVEAEVLLTNLKSDPQMFVSMADISGGKNGGKMLLIMINRIRFFLL